MTRCYISEQIANHVNQDECLCPECESYTEEKHNIYGTWVECTDCDWSTDIDDGDE